MVKPAFSKIDRNWLLGITALGLVVRMIVWLYFASDLHLLVTSKLPDDALYYFTAARSLAQGHGITYDGMHATNGMHPLWLLTITPIFFLGITKWAAIHIVLFSQSLLDVVVVWLVGKSTFNLLPETSATNRLTAAAAVQFMYAVSPIVLIQSINGLETTITALLFVVWLGQCVRVIGDHRTTRWILLGITTGFLFLARTDSFLVILPAVIYLIVKRTGTPRQYVLAILMASLIVLPWIAWNISTFGSPLQSSAQAVPFFAMKKYHVMYGGSTYLHLAWDALRNMLKPFVYSSFGFALIGLLVFFKRKTISRPQQIAFLMMLGGILLLAVHTIFRGFIREWYVEQLIPIYLVGFGVSMALMAGEVVDTKRRIATVLLSSAPLWLLITPHFLSQQSVVDQGLPVINRLSVTHKIASLNSGYYSYFSPRDGSIVNMDGVVNHEAFTHIRRGDLGQYLLRDSVGCVLEFSGDLGGYVGLIDHNLLSGFVLDSTIITQDLANPILLYRRADLPKAQGNALH